MWAVRWGVLFAGVSLAYCRHAYSAYRYPGERAEEEEYTEYDEEGQTLPKLPATMPIQNPLARIRRVGTQPTRSPNTMMQDHITEQPPTPILTAMYGNQPTRTPDPVKVEAMKGVIKEILAGRNIDPTAASWTTDAETSTGNNFTDIYDYLLKLQAARDLDRATNSWTTGTKETLAAVDNEISLKSIFDATSTGSYEADSTNIRNDSNDYKNVQRTNPVTTEVVSRMYEDMPNTTTTITTTTTTTTAAPTVATKPTIVFNVDALLDIIANLTYDYDMNLVEQFNETLIKYSVPTCPTPTTTTQTTTTTLPRFPIETTPVIAKCFVCGLDTVEIPRNAYCADAFAGDFIPLVPVDPSAKGQIARYRKYCRYSDVNNYKLDRREPRSMFGRWTGGCSVRWTDLSGVYTQRACRNNKHAVTGKHFASKRMAKLEMTLSHVKNGCIISPMASLLPLSRGISLFARFHACVCTGSWCNRASDNRRWNSNYYLLALWLLSKIYSDSF